MDKMQQPADCTVQDTTTGTLYSTRYNWHVVQYKIHQTNRYAELRNNSVHRTIYDSWHTLAVRWAERVAAEIDTYINSEK